MFRKSSVQQRDKNEQKLILLINQVISEKNINIPSWTPLCVGKSTDTYVGVDCGISDKSMKKALASSDYQLEIDSKMGKKPYLVIFDKNRKNAMVTDSEKRTQIMIDFMNKIPETVFKNYGITEVAVDVALRRK